MRGNILELDNRMMREALETLRSRLPGSWGLAAQIDPETSRTEAELTAPDGASVRLGMECCRRLEPRHVARIAEQVQVWEAQTEGLCLVVSPFLSPRTRQLLDQAQIGYLDLTGNCRLVCERPGLFVWTHGQDTNPDPPQQPSRSLKGAVAGRVVRALCDVSPPLGVRELGLRLGADPGYISRLLHFLDREALIQQEPRGPVNRVDREALLRRWSQDYRPFEREFLYPCLEPRGLGAFLDKLRSANFRYVLTGSVAAAARSPVAPARLAVAYVEDPGEVARELELIPAESGVNVWLVSPWDPVVFDGSKIWEGLCLAATSQVVADLLKSPGRGPEEAEALMAEFRGSDG